MRALVGSSGSHRNPPNGERGAGVGGAGQVETANVDFGDDYQAAEAVLSGAGVASFDEDFARFPDVRWHRPG